MRLLPFLLFTPLASAQYFSAGWQPGQAVHDTQAAPAPTFTPGAQPQRTSPGQAQPKTLSELFSINTLLTLPPVASIFERFGINITERVALSRTNFWDERIPLIHDGNFQELIVDETLTEEEEKERVWIAVITVTAAKQDGLSKILDQIFDSAYNTTVHENDLPNVRWGRIDYLDVTYLTTKWNVWQAPYLVIITDRGQTLRFYRPQQLRMRDYALREFLLNEGWKSTPPWKTRYAPGGDREWIMDVFATYLAKIYNTVILLPRWALYILSGVIGTFLIGLLHRPSTKQPTPIPKHEPKAPIQPAVSASAPSVSSSRTAQAVGVKPEPADKPVANSSATTSSTATPRRTTRKGKPKKHQA